MKYFLIILLIVIFGTVCFGFYVEGNPKYNSDAIIGVAVLALSFILMPLFIYYRWKDKKVEDYMLTQDNLEKMRERESDERKLKN